MNIPRLFAIVFTTHNEVVYCSQSYSSALAMLGGINKEVRNQFQIVRYDAVEASAWDGRVQTTKRKVA